jgi:hypothetical protein
MALSSPGVEVKVIDESFYTPAEPGTVPLIVVATAENKSNGAGDGTAPGTLKANAGQVYLLTSQKDLADTFGDPLFKTDANNNPIHAGEQNEYGLQAAYSLLGVSNRAFVVRADLDLTQLNPSADAPAADPNNGTYWLDTSNTHWGIFEWNGAPAGSGTGAQSFTNKIPLVITDPTQIDNATGGPASSVGKNGSYAVVTSRDVSYGDDDLNLQHPMSVWYRLADGTWAQVGSDDWINSFEGTPSFAMQAHTNVPQWKTAADDALTGSVWIKTTEPNLGARWRVKRWNSTTESFEEVNAPLYANSTQALYKLDKTGGGANLAVGQLYVKYNTTEAGDPLADFKLYRRQSAAPTTIKSAKITASTFAGDAGTLTGVTTIAGTSVSAAASYSLCSIANVTGSGAGAVATVTKTGAGTAYTGSNTVIAITSAGSGYQSGNQLKILGTALGGTTPTNDLTFTVSGESTAYSFTMNYTEAGSDTLSSDVTVNFTIATAGTANAATVAAAVNSVLPTGSTIEASVDSQNRLVIVHEAGGDIHFTNGTNTPLTDLGFIPFDPMAGTGAPGSEGNYTTNLYEDVDGDHDLIASLWKPLTYVAANSAPTSLTANGQLWYSSVIDEVDIMIHNGIKWVGYQNYPWDATSPWSGGPIVAASKPELNPDGAALQTGDLWIDTSDLENFPTIYKYNKDLLKWFIVDTSDQSTEDGCLFADARWTDSGVGASFTESTIEELLASDFVDFDAPDPALYPKGMLLWNLRRSGFNVKQFKYDYIDVEGDNERFNNESMSDYYPHRWVTISSNQDNGSGTFGRKAQRKVAVQALQATVNSNQQIRDEEARVFNLIACPGYPELVGELVSLNYDRGLTAFVVADTPARLTSDATSLLNWGTNQQLALEDNDLGLVSSDEYLGFFYPWGFTSDNFGNNVVVPPSHMMLRTIALNDQVAYPWFAPAGVRRGGITNATAVGYVDAEGEFKSVALNVGQRDTMASIKVNPITFITGTGLVNYGQYTRARAASALDRINVARLVVYLRRQLNALAKPYIFEPNDKITRDEIKGAVESLLLELVGQRALYDYLVVCDESNNTPSRIDRNELYIDIAIEPVKAVEFIYIPLRLKNTGEIKGLG